jgi:predicted MFS family arabinose efflux permease
VLLGYDTVRPIIQTNEVESAATADRSDIAASGGAYRLYVLWLLFFVYVIHHLDRNILLLLQEPIGKEFALSDSQLGMLTGIVYALPFALAGIPFGALADRVTRTRMVAILVVIWSGFTAITGLARSFTGLIIARAAIGAAEAGAPPCILSILSDTFPAKSRASVLSIIFMGPFIGLLAGSSLGGAAAAAFGWRGALFIAAVPGMLLALLILLTVREPARGTFDSDASRKIAAPPIGEVLRFAARHIRVRDTILAMGLASVVSIGVASWIPVLLIRVYGLPLAKAGFITALIAGLPGALGSLSAGWIASRIARGRDDQLLRLCGTALGLAAPLGCCGAWVASLPLAIAGFTLWGFANTMFIGPGHSLYLNAAAPRMRGTLSAVVVIACNLVGAGLGPLLVGSISDLLRTTGDSRPLAHAMGLIALAGLVSALLFLRARAAAVRNPSSLGEPESPAP